MQTELTHQSTPSSEEQRLQEILSQEKSKGLIDIKYFCSPNEDKDIEDYYTGAAKMINKYISGETTPVEADL